MKPQTLTLLVGAVLVAQVACHSAMEEPPARNTMWRMGFPLPTHKDDDYLICSQQAGTHCPPCGDKPEDPLPHPHEAGGKWATGIITRHYLEGETIDVHVNVTRSHGGFIELKLCPNNDVSTPVSQNCLDQFPLDVIGHRGNKVKLTAPVNEPEDLRLKVKLPRGITCDQCVLQMTQHAEQFLPQVVMFRNCADIAISPAGNKRPKSSASSGRRFPKAGVARQPLHFSGPSQNHPQLPALPTTPSPFGPNVPVVPHRPQFNEPAAFPSPRSSAPFFGSSQTSGFSQIPQIPGRVNPAVAAGHGFPRGSRANFPAGNLGHQNTFNTQF